jgi:hypothetical protein
MEGKDSDAKISLFKPFQKAELTNLIEEDGRSLDENGNTVRFKVAMVEPELKIPVAKALSFRGNHSAMVLTAAGKFPASPIPSMKQAEAKPMIPRATPWAMPATLQTAIESR